MTSAEKLANKLPADRLIDQFDALPQADPRKALAEELSRAALERRANPEERDAVAATGKPYQGQDRRKQQSRPSISSRVRQSAAPAAPGPRRRIEDLPLKPAAKPANRGKESLSISEFELTVKV